MGWEGGFEQQGSERVRFERLQSLFQGALHLAPQERIPFVESECAGDSVLLAEVTGMLEEDSSAGLLDENFAAIAERILQPEDNIPFSRVGPYRLIRMLGEGGMGIVYLAERDDVGSPVAIKFLRDAWLSAARRERFLSEQRLLAPLIHPSIARFLDAGTLDDGAPWFAMEYVEGVPITEYCRVHRCTLEERLKLFREVCGAVQYAHEHAVIHRDLKPSNILVKTDGTVRLLDFGIAKQISDLSGGPVDQTQTLRMLTPAYAAPEQIRGEPVGVFTDVYALGVILYELLAERQPFDLGKRLSGAAEHILVENAPERPSSAAKHSGCFEASRNEWADLDVLCLTAIQKETKRRYRSAEALTGDVDRFLGNQPLSARAESQAYKLRKFVRRNRQPVFGGLSVFLIVVALVTVFLIRLTHARNEALAQAARSERIKGFMQHLFDNDAQSGPSVELRAVDVLDRGAQEAGRLDKEPAVKGELLQTLGDLYEKLGKFDRAAVLLSSALSIRNWVFGNESKESAESLVSLGSVRTEQGRYADALQLIRKAVAIETKVLTPGDFALGSARMTLGRALVSSGNYKEAIAVLGTAVDSLQRAGGSSSDLFFAEDALGSAFLENGQFAMAGPECQKALALARRIYRPSNPLIAEEMVNLGSVEFSLQHFSQAEKYYRSGLEATRAWYGPDYFLVASESRLLGQALLQLGRNQEAESFLKQALSIHEKLGSLHGDGVQDLNALAVAAQRNGDLKEAEEDFNRLLQIQNTVNNGKNSFTAMALNNLADLKREQKQYARAEELSRKALALVTQVLPADHLYNGVIQLGLGRILLAQKRFREAEPYLENSYTILGKQGNPASGTLQKARTALAEDYLALGKPVDARRLGAESMSQRAKAR